MARPGSPPARRCGGVSLLELLIAVGVLGLLAATTVPLISRSSHPTQATEGAERVAAALRLARDESLRTASPHGVAFTPGTASDTIKVYVLNTASPPVPQYTVRNPLSRQLYVETLGAGSRLADARLDAQPVVTGAGNTTALSFSADGAPAITQGSGLLRLSGTSARVRVTAGAHIRDVLVAVETGRITIQ